MCAGHARCCIAFICALPFARRRAAQDDCNGVLPLHAAVGFGASEAVVVALLAAYPGAIKEENSVRLPYLHSSCAAFARSRAGYHAAQVEMSTSLERARAGPSSTDGVPDGVIRDSQNNP